VNQIGRAPEPSMTHSRSPAAHSHPPSTLRMSSVIHVASPATEDLRAELEYRHSSEDDCVTINHQRERHRCQCHNLDGVFDAVDTTLVGQATRSPTPSAGSRGGYMTLAPHIRMVVWPPMFRPHLLEKYNRSVNPVKFLQIYSTSILAVGG
jgi:hypothetical protein